MGGWRTSSKILFTWCLLGLVFALVAIQLLVSADEPYEIEAMIFGSFYLGAVWLVGVFVIAVAWAATQPRRPASQPRTDASLEPSDTWQASGMAPDRKD